MRVILLAGSNEMLNCLGICVVGVATLEDVLEYLLGKPIVGEHDSHPDMQHLARERASFRGLPEVEGDS